MNTSRRGLFGWLLGGAAVAVAAPSVAKAAAERPGMWPPPPGAVGPWLSPGAAAVNDTHHCAVRQEMSFDGGRTWVHRA